MFSKIKVCKIAKEIWNKSTLICERSDQIKENKQTLVMQKFEIFKMKPGETLDELDFRFMMITNKLTSMNKEYSKREIVLKVLRAYSRSGT